MLRAIQLIRDTPRGGSRQCHQVTHWGGRGSTNVSHHV